MPGIAMCGRCGSNLAVQTMPLEVHPPRATKWQKRFRQSFRTLPAMRELGRKARDQLGQKVLPDILIPDVPRWSILWRMLIPGWAHWYSGYPIRASVFAGSYLLCLVAAFIFVGTFSGSFSLGLAVAIHASSILDIVIRETDRVSERLATSFVTLSVLSIMVYFPLIWFVSTIIQIIPVATVAPPLARGDILISTPLLTPNVGDVIVYSIPRAEVRIPGRVYVWEGGRIDRILAGPGQKVSFRDGQLLVDNLPAAFQPLNPVRFSGTMDVTVGPHQWFVLPSTDVTASQVPVSQVSLIDRNAVQSVVLYRSYPITRIGRLQSLLPIN